MDIEVVEDDKTIVVEEDTEDYKSPEWPLNSITPLSIFRDSRNVRKLRVLFYEYNTKDPFYTLRDHDYLNLPSLRRLYLEEGDLTEYNFALKYFESWDHWKMLTECNWFKPYIQTWRTELELKLKADALKAIILESKADTRNSFVALRFIVEKGWVDKSAEPSRRGRPSKQEIARAAAEEAFANTQLSDVVKRMESLN